MVDLYNFVDKHKYLQEAVVMEEEAVAARSQVEPGQSIHTDGAVPEQHADTEQAVHADAGAGLQSPNSQPDAAGAQQSEEDKTQKPTDGTVVGSAETEAAGAATERSSRAAAAVMSGQSVPAEDEVKSHTRFLQRGRGTSEEDVDGNEMHIQHID
jgi:hypothetical protein